MDDSLQKAGLHIQVKPVKGSSRKMVMVVRAKRVRIERAAKMQMGMQCLQCMALYLDPEVMRFGHCFDEQEVEAAVLA